MYDGIHDFKGRMRRMMNGTNRQREMPPIDGFMKYGMDQQDKLEQALEIVNSRTGYFKEMEEEEAIRELEGVAYAKSVDIDDPATTPEEIADAFTEKPAFSRYEED
ncbi:MAG: hypothetical protein QXU82_01825 [Candidatus Aenigmatarchaeota archaeon]